MSEAEQEIVAHAAAMIHWCRMARYGSDDYHRYLRESEETLKDLVPTAMYEKALLETSKP